MKTKCDRMWPTCRRCARRSCVCVYPDPAKMGRPPKRKLDHVGVSESRSESVERRVTTHPNQSELQSLSDLMFRVPHNGFPPASPPTSPPCIGQHHDDDTEKRTSGLKFYLSVIIGLSSVILQVYGYSYGFLNTEFNSLVDKHPTELKLLSHHTHLLSMPLPFILFSCIVCPEKDTDILYDKKYLSCVLFGLVFACARTRAAWIVHAFPEKTYGVQIDDYSRVLNSCGIALLSCATLIRSLLHVSKPSWFWKANMCYHGASALIVASFNVQLWRTSSEVIGPCPAYFRTSNKTLNSLGAVSMVIGQCIALLFCNRSTRLWTRNFIL